MCITYSIYTNGLDKPMILPYRAKVCLVLIDDLKLLIAVDHGVGLGSVPVISFDFLIVHTNGQQNLSFLGKSLSVVWVKCVIVKVVLKY